MKSLVTIASLFFVFHSATSFAMLVPGTVSTYKIKDKDRVTAIAIRIQGSVAYPMAEEIQAAFEQIEPGLDVLLDLNSTGGYTDEGYKIIAVIEQQRARHKIDSYVGNGSVCASMCVPIYVQGEEKIAAPASAFMLHGASTSYSNAIEPTGTEKYINALLERNVSSSFIQSLKLVGVFVIPADYWASGKDLFEGRTGLVDKLSPGIVFHEPWSLPVNPDIRPR